VPEFDIVMIGNFAKDKLIVDGVETIASGGGVYYGSVVISRLGLRVAVVTRLHPDDFPRLDEMRSEGVTVFATPADGTSGIANYYQSTNMETRITKPIGFGGKYRLEDIPDFNTKLIMLSPLFAGEIDLPLMHVLAKSAPLALDIQGFVRVPVGDDLVFLPWDQMDEGLKYITYLKLDKAEASYLTGLSDLDGAAATLQALGPKELVLTQTSGVTVYVDEGHFTAPFTSSNLSGRTGRGDTCFSTYLAKRLSGSAEEACKWAAAVTSRKQEVPGPWKGSPSEIQTYLDAN